MKLTEILPLIFYLTIYTFSMLLIKHFGGFEWTVIYGIAIVIANQNILLNRTKD